MRVVAALAAMLLLAGFSYGDELFPLDAIGRLRTDGRSSCTAFIVRSIERESREQFDSYITYYDNWIVSAGHCRGDDMRFTQHGNGKSGTVTTIAYTSNRGGFDLFVGRFYTTEPMPTLELAFDTLPAVGDTVLMVGYGRKAFMPHTGQVTAYDDRGFMEISNYASPGNSGGPVVLPGTRKVVGVAIESTIDMPPGTSVRICAMIGCARKPPYVAVPVSKLLGLVRW